jgi:hypothetical protein
MRTRTLHRHAGAPLAALAALALAGSAEAAVPGTITQQGRLYDANDMPVSGTKSVTFAIYTDDGGPNQVWSETDAITFDDGYFSVELGAATPFPPTVFDGSTRYLEITVGSGPALTPRAPIVSVPYAMLCGDVNGDIHPTSVTVNGHEVIDSNGNWVGGGMGGVGPTGATGAQGPAGPAGATGAQGPAGPAGPMGAQGPVGPTGAAGPQGPMGPVGPTGAQGAQGPMGAPGPVGPTGAQGATGATGAVGPTGPSVAPAPVVVDGNGVVLGRLLQVIGNGMLRNLGVTTDYDQLNIFSYDQYTFLTSTGHVVSLGGDGTPANTPAFGWSGAGCTGTPYVAAGSFGVGAKILASKTVYSVILGQFLAPGNADASGLATSATFPLGSVDTLGACSPASGSEAAFLMTPLTNAQVGLPATIKSPLHVQ